MMIGNQIQNFGIIKNCDNHISKCKCKCCKFDKNYIVLYPGEIESTKQNKTHLKIIDDNYYNGKKAICLRPCKNDDFKPIDCRSYPFFPKINERGVINILISVKCPLKKEELVNHKNKFFKIWKLLTKDKEIYDWINKVKLIGYKSLEE